MALDPKSLRGHFWLAIIAEQDGRKADAEKIYREMLSENIAPAWQAEINKRLAALNGEAAAGPSSAEDQGAMIRSMVERLAARLKDNAGGLDDWLRLIRSYRVLKETAKADEAAASTRKQFASDSKALARIDEEAGAGGQEPGAAPAAPGGVIGDDQDAMIRGMVERLAARLQDNGGTLEDWLRLIRSYAVLRETDKAQEAAASARKQFASEHQALEEIGTLTKGLGLTMPETQGERR